MSALSTSDDISAHLEALFEMYDGFDVEQTTVTVAPEAFQAIDARGDVARVRVRVTSSDGVLLVREGSEWNLPGAVVEQPFSPAPSDIVREQAGLNPTVEGLDSVTLVCLQSEDGEEVWELSALFEATVDGGRPAGDAEWRDRLQW